jgi:hypothetical protein
VITTLVNINRGQEYDEYIGRAGHGLSGYFGNPPEHSFGGVGRDTIVERYRVYFYKRIAEDAEFRRRVAELKGRRLGCFCVPLKCHGMVIIEYLEGISVEEQMLAFKKTRKQEKPPRKEAHPSINIFED